MFLDNSLNQDTIYVIKITNQLVIFGGLAILGTYDKLYYSHCWPYAFVLSPDPRSLCGPAYEWFIAGIIFVIGGGALIITSRF